MEAVVEAGSDLEFEAPRQIFEEGIPGPVWGTSFDSTHDGRLIMSNTDFGGLSNAERPTLVVVLNWFKVVERLAPRR